MLSKAIIAGNIKFVNRVLEMRYGLPKYEGSYGDMWGAGERALFRAVQKSNAELVEILLDCNARVPSGEWPEKPFRVKVWRSYFPLDSIPRLLAQTGFDDNDSNPSILEIEIPLDDAEGPGCLYVTEASRHIFDRVSRWRGYLCRDFADALVANACYELSSQEMEMRTIKS